MTRSESSVTLIAADAVCDANLSVVGDRNSQAALLIEQNEQGLRVLALGMLDGLLAHPASAAARRLDRPGCVLLPGLVNAHTHLDLTHIGPQPHDWQAGFVSWVDMVRAGRLTQPDAIADSVRQGVALLRKGGVVAVGDIAGAAGGSPTLVPFETLADSGIAGVSYLEFFAIGTRTQPAIARLLELIESVGSPLRGRVQLGIQPHAPNTVLPEAYDAAGKIAASRNMPLITHLAESIEEMQFVAEGSGPQLELIERLGIWNEASAAEFGHGKSPVEHLAAVLAGYSMNAVHVNQCSDSDLNLLALTRTGVVYCPRASEYFGADRHFGPHRYKEMLERGISVALGTDSIINLPKDEIESGGLGLSTLAEARFLFRRDGFDPNHLLAMMTIHGAAILGIPSGQVTLGVGAEPLGILAIEAAGVGNPALRVLKSDSVPEFAL